MLTQDQYGQTNSDEHILFQKGSWLGSWMRKGKHQNPILHIIVMKICTVDTCPPRLIHCNEIGIFFISYKEEI